MNAPVKESVLEFAREELGGKLLQLCVGQLEKLKNPWNLTSEKNQEITINKMREVIEGAVRNAVMVIATDRMPLIKATIGKVTFEDESIKVAISLSKQSEGRHEIADAVGSTAAIILAHPEVYASGAQKVSAKPDQNKLPLGESVPEIRQEADETWTIYKDNMPMPGGKGFGTQGEAEAWLQKHLGIDKKKKGDEGKPALPGAWPFPTDEGSGTEGAPQAPDDPPPPPPVLEEVIAAFKAAGKSAGQKNEDWDTALALVRMQYPTDFVDDHLTELDSAFTDGWEESGEPE